MSDQRQPPAEAQGRRVPRTERDRRRPRSHETSSGPSGVILEWQRTVGNAAVARLLLGARVLARETGLKIGTKVVVALERGEHREGVIVDDVREAKRYRVEHPGGKRFLYPYDKVTAVPAAAAASQTTAEKPEPAKEKEEEGKGKDEKTESREKKEKKEKKVNVDADAYGEALNSAVITIFAANPVFEASDAQKKYNPRFWTARVKQVDGESCTELHVRDIDCVAEAIDDLVESARSYTFDCASFVQAVNLYAWRQADRDAAHALRSAAKSNRGTFAFSEHDSTGLGHRRLYYRDAQHAPLKVRTPASDQQNAAEDTYRRRDEQLLDECPVGSRVSFKNYSRGVENSNWERENTVKIGPGRYAAFPLGGNETAATVKRKLAMRGLGDVLGQAYERLGDEDKRRADALKDDAEKLVEWILANRRKISDEILHDDLNEHVEHWIGLEAVEVYKVTPEHIG